MSEKRVIDATMHEQAKLTADLLEQRISQLFRPDGDPVNESEESAILKAITTTKLAPDQANEFLYQMRGKRYKVPKDSFNYWINEGRLINYGTEGMMARYCPKELLAAFDSLGRKTETTRLQAKIRQKLIEQDIKKSETLKKKVA